MNVKKYLKFYDRVIPDFITSHRVLAPEGHAAVLDIPAINTIQQFKKWGGGGTAVGLLTGDETGLYKAWLYTALAALPSS
jgi:hypothetical protein